MYRLTHLPSRLPSLPPLPLASTGLDGVPSTDGAWVLTAAILGSSMAFIDGTVINCIPCVRGVAAVDCRGIRLVIVFAVALGRILWRSVWAKEELSVRSNHLRKCVGGVWLRPYPSDYDHQSCDSGRRGSTPRPRKPSSHKCFLPGEGAR